MTEGRMRDLVVNAVTGWMGAEKGVNQCTW